MNANDRCDRCGARASVIAVLHSGAGTLLFCGHHAQQRHPVLEGIAHCSEDPASRTLVTAA
jgi:hypothetical protein